MEHQNKNDNQEISEVLSPSKASEDDENRMIVNNGVNQMNKTHKKYMKVSLQTKQQLYQMVQKEGLKIKEAAKILGIKYATAKTIVYHRRQKRKQKGKCGMRMCGYTEIVDNRVSRLQIVSITGNDAKQCKEYIL